MPGYGSRGYQARGQPSGGDIGRGSQRNNQTGNNSQSGTNSRGQGVVSSRAYNPRIPPRANTQSNQGNQHANEFANIGSSMQAENEQRARDQEKRDRVQAQMQQNTLDRARREREEKGDVYKPYTTSRKEQFESAFGGLDYDWSDPDDSRTDFLTKDIWGNPIRGGPDNRLWDPFVKGYDPETGKERRLSFDEWNTMLDYGEFDAGPIGNYSGYGGGGGGWGGGYGGHGGGGGGGGGYGGYGNYGSGSQVYQRGQVGPGSLQEQVNQAYLSGGKGFSRGGIVSLLRL